MLTAKKSEKPLDRGQVPGYSGRVSYVARLTTYGKEWGISVEVSGDLDPDKLTEEAAPLDAFMLAKHRELELAYMDQAGK